MTMERSFQAVRLPLGAYQFLDLLAVDLGDQFTESGKEPRTLSAAITSPGPDFKNQVISLHLTEKAQRAIIAILEANLSDNINQARNLIERSHPEYGRIEQ